MTYNLLDKYREEYDLYIQYHKFISPSNIGLGCSVGWLPILRELFEYWDANGIEAKVVQIKEKFGDLRVYFDSQMTDEQQTASHKILAKSYSTCDVCGSFGDKEGCTGWVVTRCLEHKEFKPYPENISYDDILKVTEPLEAKLRELIGPRKERNNPWIGATKGMVIKDGNF